MTVIEPAIRFVSGKDVFISYARYDGVPYVVALTRLLAARGFACAGDLLATQPAEETPETLITDLIRSSMMIVVVSPGAAASGEVARELERFRDTGRTLLVINVDRALAVATWKSTIPGLPPIPESAEALREGRPSPYVLEAIENAAEFRRLDDRLRSMRRWAGGSAAVLTLVAVAASLVAWNASREATRNSERAQANLAHNILNVGGRELEALRSSVDLVGRHVQAGSDPLSESLHALSRSIAAARAGWNVASSIDDPLVIASQSGRRIVVCRAADRCELRDGATYRLLRTIPVSAVERSALGFLADDSLLVGEQSGHLRQVDGDGREMRRIDTGSGAIVRLITRDNLALTQHPRAVIRWTFPEGRAERGIPFPSDVRTADLARSGAIAAALSDGAVILDSEFPGLWFLEHVQRVVVAPNGAGIVALTDSSASWLHANNEAPCSFPHAPLRIARRIGLSVPALVTVAAISEYRQDIATAGSDRTIRIWNIGRCEGIKVLPDAGEVRAISYGGGLLAAADNRLDVWNVQNSTRVISVDAHVGAVTSVGSSDSPESGSRLTWAIGAGRSIRFWENGPPTGSEPVGSNVLFELPLLSAPPGSPLSEISPSIETTNVHGITVLRDRGSGQVLVAHNDTRWVTLAPAGDWVATRSYDDCTIGLVNLQSAVEPIEMRCDEKGVSDVLFSGDGRTLLVRSTPSNRWSVWERGSAKPRAVLDLKGVRSIAIAPDGRELAVVGDTLEFRDSLKGGVIQQTSLPNVISASYSADGRRLVLVVGADSNRRVEVWARQPLKQLRLLNFGQQEIVTTAVSRSGRLLAVIPLRGEPQIIDLTTGESVAALAGFGTAALVNNATFTSDENLLLVGGAVFGVTAKRWLTLGCVLLRQRVEDAPELQTVCAGGL